MKRFFKRFTILFVITFVLSSALSSFPTLPGLSEKKAMAAVAESKLNTAELTTGIDSTPAYVSIDNYNDGVLYKYTSEDTNIATVDENGLVYGVALGKTFISVIETIDGVDKSLGSVPVSVLNTEFADKIYYAGLSSNNYLNVNYLKMSAVYKYTSADSDIASVDDNGAVTGYKLGKTTVTLTETYKGKTTKIGTLPVHVVKAKLDAKVQELPISNNSSDMINIKYSNSEAVYKYRSSNSKIVRIDQSGYMTGLKEGTAKISVTEVYNKKSRALGTVTVNVKTALIIADRSDISIPINSSNYFFNIIEVNNANWDAQYTCVSADNSIVSVGYEKNFYGEKNFMIKGLSLGETSLTVYEEYKGVKKNIGTLHVTVKEFPIVKLAFEPDYFDNVNGVLSKTFYIGTDYSPSSIKNLLTIRPYNTSNPISFTSSDEKVIKIDEYGYVVPVSEGSATITVTCGNLTVQMKAIVVPASASANNQ